jgi:hypothetical protein
MAIPFTEFKGVATIGSAPRSLPGDTTSGVPTSQTTKGRVTGFLDFSALAAGDVFKVQFYEKVNGGTQRLVDTWYIPGAQAGLWPLPEMSFSEGWDAVCSKESGNDCSVRWALKQEVGDVNNAATIEGQLFNTWMTRLVRLFQGKRSGYSGASPRTILVRDIADTKNAITITNTDDGWTAISYND